MMAGSEEDNIAGSLKYSLLIIVEEKVVAKGYTPVVDCVFLFLPNAAAKASSEKWPAA
jgi:hypothetical protein